MAEQVTENNTLKANSIGKAEMIIMSVSAAAPGLDGTEQTDLSHKVVAVFVLEQSLVHVQI